MSQYSPVALSKTVEGEKIKSSTIDFEPFDTIIDRLKVIRAQLQVMLNEYGEENTDE